jgi:hypothetical protein
VLELRCQHQVAAAAATSWQGAAAVLDPATAPAAVLQHVAQMPQVQMQWLSR